MPETFIGQLLTDYCYVDDLPVGEKNLKWLQDDYVKFIRFAQWRIERTEWSNVRSMAKNEQGGSKIGYWILNVILVVIAGTCIFGSRLVEREAI